MERLDRLRGHLTAPAAAPTGTSATPIGLYLSPPDVTLSTGVYESVLTPEARAFVARIAVAFAPDVDELFAQRKSRRLPVPSPTSMPPLRFAEATRSIRDDPTWTIDPLPRALRDRRVDIGDVAPCDGRFLLRALNSGANGVQVDFDDGHCPTWTNVLQGHKNIMDAVRGTLLVPGESPLCARPALVLVRPRAWNMDETNMIVNGRVVPGAIFDFALHLFHNGSRMHERSTGPFVYLPKLESASEARLWRKIFQFTERELKLPSGTIKATVLIESIFAAFEMDEILYELRHHSSGLNCGMWDYTASIIVNFGHDPRFVLPDRQRFVSMKSPFLQHYMELLIATCRKRKAPATTGMIPFVLDQLPATLPRQTAITKALAGKRFEAQAGSDGALVYDLELVKPIQEIFAAVHSSQSPQPVLTRGESFYEDALMTLPRGEVTMGSVRLNLIVALSYTLAWFRGNGTVVVNGCVEDSATAEISRAQLWQWIHHQVPLTGTKLDGLEGEVTRLTASCVHSMLMTVAREMLEGSNTGSLPRPSMRQLVAAINLVFRVITARTPPTFVTTFLLEQEPLTKSLE